MQAMLIRLMSTIEYLIIPKGTKFTGLVKLGLRLPEREFIMNTIFVINQVSGTPKDLLHTVLQY